MKHSIEHTAVDYFTSHVKYFWQWEDQGEIITSSFSKKTITYRKDLLLLLKDISPTISPRLAQVLLILLACNDDYETKEISYDNTTRLISNAQDDETVTKEILEYHIFKAFKLLKRIHRLPKEFRTGQKRVLLLTTILEKNDISIPNFSEILNDFESGNFDDTIFSNSEANTYAQVLADFHVISKAENLYPNVEILQEKLETSIVDLKEVALPLEEKDVLKELLQHRDTAPLSELATHLMAGLKIPVSNDEQGEFSLGGMSDVTNKGDFDKLLLSELAYSDDVFLSRLINNEALYINKEIVAENVVKNRILLMDATIKTWGTPRILSLASALAFRFHPKSKKKTKLMLLDGQSYSEQNVDEENQIKEALKFLSPYLDCAESLFAICGSNEIDKKDEVILLIEESNFNNEKVQNIFNAHRQQFNFLVTVNRNGEINYFSSVKGVIKNLGHTIVDLEKVVNAKRTFGKEETFNNESSSLPFLPAFFKNAPKYPILCTLTKHVKDEELVHLPKGGVIVKNRFNELVYYPKGSSPTRRKAGYIIKNNIGNYRFKFALCPSQNYVFLLTFTTKKLAGFSIIHLIDFSIEYFDLKSTVSQNLKNINEVCPYQGNFYIKSSSNKAYLFNRKSCDIEEVNQIKSDEIKDSKNTLSYNYIYVESPFVNINTVKITSDCFILFNDKLLEKHSNFKSSNFYLRANPRVSESKTSTLNYPVIENVKFLKNQHLFENPKLKFRHVTFKDGSEIIFDNKGFAHLISSNENIPELTIKIQLNGPVSFFAADRNICAEPYLINNEMMLNEINTNDIENNYLNPFIETILEAYQ
ncbi:hypothetical protein [Wenyingzhuangia sp. IMCC45574]